MESMLLYLRTIFIMLGWLSVVDAGVHATCKDEREHVIACEQALFDLVNEQIAPYGKTFSTIDLDNDTESELLDEKTRDVVCSTANVEYVSCMVGNITACPELADDEDIASTWIASLIAPNLDILNSTHRVCEFFEDSVCSYREIKLNLCYNSIVGDIVTVNQNVDMCNPGKRHNLTCMIELYKECKPYLNLTSNGVIAANIRRHMVEDRWDTFSTGSELCDCYEGDNCYSSLHQDIASHITSPDSVKDKYQKIVALGQTLCSNITRIQCAKKGRSKTCMNILQNFTDSQTKIDVYTTAVDLLCHIVNTSEFKSNKHCIIDRLTESYHPCIEDAKLPQTLNTCRNFQKLYKCVSSALKGQCSADYIDIAYDMIRTSLNNFLECDVTSAAFGSFPSLIATLIFVFVVHIFCTFCGK